MNELHWKNLALWLLDCEAATTQHLVDLKSSSKSEKNRHQSICTGAVNMIESFGQIMPKGIYLGTPDFDRIVARAKRACTTKEK